MKQAEAAFPLMDRVRPLDSDGPLQSVLVSAYALGLNDPPFFDQDFLPTLLGLGGVRHRGFSSPATLERGLGKIYCGLVCDAHALVRGGRPSLRVDVIPVGSQIQHAKVILIHRERMIRLIISSANLTHESFRLNREAAVALEFHERSYMPSGILAEFARNWVERVGTAATADFGGALQQAVAQAAEWDSRRNLPITVKTIWGGGEEPLWKQIVERWPEGEHIKEWHICSPFWPTVTDGETPFERFQSELNKRAARLSDAELTLYAQGDVQGENAHPRFPFALVTQLKRRGFNPAHARICPVRLDPLKDEIPEGKAEDQRQLHAKWMLLKGDRTALLLLGSANFTRRGFGVLDDPQNANIEACVLLSGSRDVVTATELMPPIASDGVVNWSDCQADDVSEPLPETELEPWPEFIDRIEVEVSWEALPLTGTLIVQCSDATEFSVGYERDDETVFLTLSHTENHTYVTTLSDADLSALLARRQVVITWKEKTLSACFPINIASKSKAGLPAVLGQHPTEQDLLAYFHGRIDEEDLMNLLIERAAQKAGERPAVFEPGRELQNYVVREFLESLYGMADSLRHSAVAERTFEQAMLGEFSPVRLANEVKQSYAGRRRTPTAAAFQLLELLSLIENLSPPAIKPIPAWFHSIRERAIQKLLLIASEAAKFPEFREKCQTTSFAELVSTVLKQDTAQRWMDVVSKS